MNMGQTSPDAFNVTGQTNLEVPDITFYMPTMAGPGCFYLEKDEHDLSKNVLLNPEGSPQKYHWPSAEEPAHKQGRIQELYRSRYKFKAPNLFKLPRVNSPQRDQNLASKILALGLHEQVSMQANTQRFLGLDSLSPEKTSVYRELVSPDAFDRKMTMSEANNRGDIESNLLKSRYKDAKLKSLRYYKVSEVLSSPNKNSPFIDTKQWSATKVGFKNLYDQALSPKSSPEKLDIFKRQRNSHVVPRTLEDYVESCQEQVRWLQKNNTREPKSRSFINSYSSHLKLKLPPICESMEMTETTATSPRNK